MIVEALLREDGSVIELRYAPDPGSRPASAPPTDGIFSLDGLPRSQNGTEIQPIAEGDTDSWMGGFSFAVWDRERQSLRAYRDHYGARPLYYWVDGARILLSSEIPALLVRIPDARLDEIAVAEYLATGVLGEGRTFHEGISRVPAASVLTAGRSGIKVERYWRPWAGPRTGSNRPDDLDAEFRALFRRAVQATLGDGIPAGVLLSGGPDSSSVLGMAASLAREGILSAGTLRIALTMAFEKLPQCDETSLARDTAAMCGVRWRSVRVEHASPLYGFAQFIERHGEPPCGANLALDHLLFEAAREEGVRVLLDGFDADALFLPSGEFLSDLLRRRKWARLTREWAGLRWRHKFGLRRLARETFGPFARQVFPSPRRTVPRWIRPDFAGRTNLGDRLRSTPDADSFEEREAERALAPRVWLTLESTRTLERLHGIERRHPYFDPELVRFLVSVPLEHRFPCGETKILMRRALADLLTPSVRRRIGKTRYRAYFDSSLREALGHDLAALTTSRASPVDPYVDRKLLSPVIGAAMQGGAVDPALWRIIALEHWLELARGGRKEAHFYEEATAT